MNKAADRSALALLTGIYVTFSVTYSVLTPAWEPNDELDHALYVEHIVAHGTLPRIALANGIESHQPPLYYLLVAAWQKLLGIPAFTPSASPVPGAPPRLAPGRFYTYSHQYTALQHRNAYFLHELRAVSVVLGLVTVLASYGCARMVLRRPRSALCAGLTVALWPKQLVVDSALTNDSLVICLCSLALLLFLASESARRRGDDRQRRWALAGLGAVLGLAALAKFNSLPLAVVLLVLSAWPVVRPGKGRRSALTLDVVIALLLAGALASWWFVRNRELYGQFLASRASEDYLKQFGYGLISPVAWTNTGRLLHFVPSHLYHSFWYDGSGNQWLLPNWMNNALWVLAGLSALSVVAALVRRNRASPPWQPIGILAGASLALAIVAGLAAVVIIAQTTTQAEGRIALVAISSFATVLVMGTDLGAVRGRSASLAVGLWPAVMFAVNVYVIATYVVPMRAL